MSETQNTDHWKSLADQVGADVPPETDQNGDDTPNVETASQPTQVELPANVAAKPNKPKSVPQPENHWGVLAGELGLEVPETDMELPSDAPMAETTSEELDSVDDNVASLEPESSSVFHQNDSASSSMFDESSAGTTAEYVDDRFVQDADFGEEENVDSSATENALDESTDQRTSTTDDDESEDVEGESRPRRRRRRLRRRSRRSKDVRGSDSNDDSEKSNDQSMDDAEEINDAANSSDVAETEEDDDHRSSNQKAKHRKIPTWEETIGVVVTANMDARTKSSGGGGGRRGRGRGRGRK